MRHLFLIAAAALLVAGCNTTKQEQTKVESRTFTPSPQYTNVGYAAPYAYTSTYATPQTYNVSRNTGNFSTHDQYSWNDPASPQGNRAAPQAYSNVSTTFNQTSYDNSSSGFVGDRGPQGPDGAAGQRGDTGQAGASGQIITGPRGPAGPTGYAGEHGLDGAPGAPGAVVQGLTGVQGAPGYAGAQGASGQMGAQGSSAYGPAGEAGPRGPTGPSGPAGPSGARGATLHGPTGPAGHSGDAGAAGQTGSMGATGSTSTGIAGPAGPSGPQGPQGGTGQAGASGSVGIVHAWTSYRDFCFDGSDTMIRQGDMHKVTEIATYMKSNSSLQLGIDGKSNQLSESRVNSIRDALVNAGVSANQIQTGAFGNSVSGTTQCVEILLISGR